jgi:hypothetical protein
MATLRHLGLFPFCLGNKALVPSVFAEDYTIAMNLDELMAAFYRVKTWSLTWWGGTNGIPARTFYQFTQDPQALVYSVFPNNEKGLICLSALNGQPITQPDLTSFFATSTDTADGNANPVNFTMFNAQMFYQQTNTNLSSPSTVNVLPAVRSQAEQYWPQFVYGGNTPPFIFSNDYFDLFEPIPFNTNKANLVNPLSVGAATLSFLGKTFTTSVYISEPPPPDLDDDPEFAAAILERNAALIAHAEEHADGSVEATEYWPYDPGDGGGPIYDSATGAQLRPFPA